ncbi:MAG: nitrilase-related carbon-nitrogen hydrolase [Acidobacteriota bacterium]
MSSWTVAGLQTEIVWEDPQANFRHVEALAQRAVAAGAKLLVLPEMFATGFSMRGRHIARWSQEIEDFASHLARQSGVWVAAGYAEPGLAADEDALPRNVCALLSPQGEVAAKYSKIHPFSLAGEHEQFAGGTESITLDLGGLRVTPLICYDLRFPEVFRCAAGGTDLFLVVANWPDPRVDAWSTLLRARAIENQAFVLGVNRVGKDANGLPHSGCSALLDPLGRPRSTAAGAPGLVLGEVTAAEVQQVRQRFGFLDDRREGVYSALQEERAGSS